MKVLSVVAFLFLLALPLNAQRAIEYEVSFDNAVHHEAVVTVKFTDVPQEQPLEVRMSRTSPGRYALHEFAKNVYNVKVTDGEGDSLAFTRPSPHQWDIAGHDGTVIVRYTLFGDHASGTYTGIDRTHAHLSMPATFMWARGLEDRPITIRFTIPKESGWKAATQLPPSGKEMTFTAPNMQYFMDSPVELSNHTLKEWTVPGAGGNAAIKLALHHEGNEEEANVYAEMVKAVVLEERAVFGELPRFDYGEYVFLTDYLPYVYGDGMEHRNSTSLTGTRPLKTNAMDNIGTVAHEFFHCWNIERLRPRSIEPFNFEEPSVSGELWFGEGFTSYYDEITLIRAGISSIDRFAKGLSWRVGSVVSSPGRMFASVVEMSEQAALVDGATFIDERNTGNTYISYYTYGAALALGLDLMLREKFPGVTLDDFMKAAWEKFGKTETPYTLDDLRAVLAGVTGDREFADSFFRKHIFGREVVDYEALLAPAGFLLRKAKAGKASLGNPWIRYDDGKAIVGAPTTINTPLYKAGIDKKDRIIRIGGMALASAKDMDSLLARRSPGDTATIEFEQRGAVRTALLTFEENTQLEVVPFEHASKPITEEIAAFRAQWLESRSPEALPALTRICPACSRRFPMKFDYCQFDGEGLRITIGSGK